MGKKGKVKIAVATSPVEVEEKPKELAEKNLDEFLNDWDESDSEDGDKESDGNDQDEDEDEAEEGSEGEEEEDGDEEEEPQKLVKNKKEKHELKMKEKATGAKDQKKYISKLKQNDPEFFEFLKENDQELLNFNESSDDDEDNVVEKEKLQKRHKLPQKLEVASDESDFEDEDEAGVMKEGGGDSKKVTKSQVDSWTAGLASQPTAALLTEVIEAFRGAVAAVAAGGGAGEARAARYRVEGGAIFNCVVRAAVVHLVPGLRKVLRLDGEVEGAARPEKSKHWKKLERPLRAYMLDLVVLLGRVSESSVLSVLLKHVHAMLPFYQAFGKGAKQLLVRLVAVWSRAEETPRILAFMCIVKLVRGRDLLEPCIKAMYLAYVKNCKFTSPASLQGISFMRRSLVELLGLDHSLAYYQAFVYIRQLAIHLRNAITCSEKKDSLQAVYNWQFVHSLELWGALIGHPGSREAMQPLLYPLVQVVLGACRLIPTPKYFPLRFHCADILRGISASTATFIPVLPIYLEVLNTYNFSQKSKKASMKPLDFSCILKLSKSQLVESGMKDTTMEEVYGGLLAYLADNSNRIGFPELVTPMLFQLKEFLKKCKVANYAKKIKQVVDKTVANQKFIETRRRNVTFGVGDRAAIEAWEAQVARDGTPLLAYYTNWKKVSDIQHAKKVSEQAKLDDYSHIPALKKNHKKLRMKREQEGEVEAGFLSGSDDDFDDEENFRMKEDRGKKRKNSGGSEDSEEEEGDEDESEVKKSKKTAVESDEEDMNNDLAGEDEVEDLNLEDLDSDLEMDDDFGAADDVEENNSEEDSGDSDQ